MSGSIPRPVTTTVVDIDPAEKTQLPKGGKAPPRDISHSVTTSGEIDAAEGAAAAAPADAARTASVIVDDAALVGASGGRMATVGAVARGLGAVAESLMDGAVLMLAAEASLDISRHLLSGKNGAGSEAAVTAHIMDLMQKNEPQIQAALKGSRRRSRKNYLGKPRSRCLGQHRHRDPGNVEDKESCFWRGRRTSHLSA